MKVKTNKQSNNLLTYSEVMQNPGLYQVYSDSISTIILISSQPNFNGKQAPLLWLNTLTGTLSVADDGYKDKKFQPFFGEITLSN